jgi:hypothetical protein
MPGRTERCRSPVERASLLRRCGVTATVGSNPTLSAASALVARPSLKPGRLSPVRLFRSRPLCTGPTEPIALHSFCRLAAGRVQTADVGLWKDTLSSGRRLTATSPLGEFHTWAVEARVDIQVFGSRRRPSPPAGGWAPAGPGGGTREGPHRGLAHPGRALAGRHLRLGGLARGDRRRGTPERSPGAGTNHLLHRWPDPAQLPDARGPIGTAALTYRRWTQLRAANAGGALVDRDDIREQFTTVRFVAPVQEARTFWHALDDVDEARVEVSFHRHDRDGERVYSDHRAAPECQRPGRCRHLRRDLLARTRAAGRHQTGAGIFLRVLEEHDWWSRPLRAEIQRGGRSDVEDYSATCRCMGRAPV